MNRDDIIRMAREAGFSQPWTAPKETQERLERFAALIAAAEREAILKMLEAEWFQSQEDVETAIRERS